MKSSVYALIVAFALSLGVGGYSSDVEAKKFGGGKSFGKSFSTPKQTAAPTSTGNTSGAAAAGTTKKSGFLGGLGGGLLGGLLVGGLFATLFAGGAFEGFAFGDILLFAVVGFLIYKFFIAPKRRQAAQAAGVGTSDKQMFRNMEQPANDGRSTGGFGGQSSTPVMQFPPGFNAEAFVDDATNHYKALQVAWDENDFEEIQDYVSPELYNLLKEERKALGADKPKTEVVSVIANLVRGEYIGSTSSISLEFTGSIKEGEHTSDTKELWHLEKSVTDANSNWTIVGIEQSN